MMFICEFLLSSLCCEKECWDTSRDIGGKGQVGPQGKEEGFSNTETCKRSRFAKDAEITQCCELI